MISLYDKLEILRTAIVVSCEFKKSGYATEKLKTTVCQNCLITLALHINFDVSFNVERVTKTFSVGNTGDTSSSICASITLKFNLFQYDFDVIYELSINQ